MGRLHHHWRLQALLTVQPGRVAAAAAVLFDYTEANDSSVLERATDETHSNMHTFSQILTFGQFPFICSGGLGLFAPAGTSTADPTDDRHGVIVTSHL